MMYSGLLIILLPLIIGYLVPLRAKKALQLINQLLSWMVYVILFLMGISLAFLENISSNLLLIFRYTAVFAFCIVAANGIALWLWEKRTAWRSKYRDATPPSRLRMILESFKLCSVVFGGFLLGLTHWSGFTYASKGSEYALIFLLFLVGVQLRNSAPWSGHRAYRRYQRVRGRTAGRVGVGAAAENRSGDGIRLWVVFAVWHSADRCARARHRQRGVFQRSDSRTAGYHARSRAGTA